MIEKQTEKAGLNAKEEKRAKKEARKERKLAKQMEKLAEELKPIRNYFVRLFGKIQFKNEQQFLFFGKWMVLLLLFIVEMLMILQNLYLFNDPATRYQFICMLVLVGGLTTSEILHFFVFTHPKMRIAFYVIDAVSACLLLFFADGTNPLILFMLALTEFYIGTEKMRVSFIAFGLSLPVYALTYALNGHEWQSLQDVMQIVRGSLGPVVALIAHFIIVHIAIAFYRQYLKLNRALEELDESKKELEKAYAVVAEVTALEERQRIAKDIHDTAGHSITTVIMQTEVAKRIIDNNPEEAKTKIVAANLQAKHALEELRDSVHLLSGIEDNATLKDSLLSIIHESTDGTGITIRSEIEDIEVSDAKFRFLCNSLKEGISNGLRHGGATAFWFELKEDGGGIRFLLSDNGTGVRGKIEPGFGLSTMQQRAKALGGELSLRADEEEGFELQLVLPKDGKE